jgi:excinuclease ABC subunit C
MWQDESNFDGFGPNPLDPENQRNLVSTEVSGRDGLRAAVRREAPKSPGVYGMIDRNDRLIYVGKSKSLRSRLLSYFCAAAAGEKAGKIIETARRIVWEVQPGEFAALIREQQLIRRWTPRWNVQEIPKRQRPVYLCLGRGPAASFFLCRLPPADVISCEGPFHGAGRMGRAVDTLNSFFKLRDCKNSQGFSFSNQMSLFDLDHRPGCLRYEIGTCSGPCAAKVSLKAYNEQISAARSFLDGFNGEPLTALQDAMERAAQQRNYEYAARLRDDLRAMEYLYGKLLWLAEARRRYTFVYAASSPAGNSIWYLIRAGEVADHLAAPQCPSTYAQARGVLRRWRAETESTCDRGHGPYPHTLSLVASWFRKHPHELGRTFHPADAGRKYRGLAARAVA